MQQLLRPPGQRVATAQPLAALPLTDAACPLRASGTRGKRSWSNAFLQPDAVGTRAAGINCQVSAAPCRARRTVLANPQAPSHADPRTATLHACAKLRPKRSFLLDRARPVFFSTRWKRKWGGASPLDKPPAGADTPPAAVAAAPPPPAQPSIRPHLLSKRGTQQPDTPSFFYTIHKFY